MTELLVELLFGHSGRSSSYAGEGWGPVEPTHRWTVGQESRIRLPVAEPGPDCILVIDAVPWCDETFLKTQTVMLAINGRLMATVRFSDHRTFAFAFPSGPYEPGDVWLSFSHLNALTPRPAAGLDHYGYGLGLLLTRLRVFRLQQTCDVLTRPRLAGDLDGSLQDSVLATTGLQPPELATRFESIGHNCEFGLVQRGFGAEPLGLLRFASTMTHALVEGVMQRFEGVGDPATTRIYASDPPEPEFKVQDELYYLWYSTGKLTSEGNAEVLHHEQCRRLSFLQRKFAEDLTEANKVYVVTRAEPMMEAEALALFCALTLHGPNTLLWTVHGDSTRAGQVDRLLPGFLRGHLGEVDEIYYARSDAWLSVLANAYVLTQAEWEY